MKRYIPKDKLSKKARRLLDIQRRATWLISPVTRTVESKKIYNRHRKSRELQDGWKSRDFLFCRRESFDLFLRRTSGKVVRAAQ